jgi:hypothetical protein
LADTSWLFIVYPRRIHRKLDGCTADRTLDAAGRVVAQRTGTTDMTETHLHIECLHSRK